MTVAVCFKCGSFKYGAITPCENCGAEPKNQHEMAISVTLSDHSYDEQALRRIGAEIKAGRPAPIDRILFRATWI